MNILVTGGAGFIGSNFIKYMLDKHSDYKIINYDLLTYAGNLENLKDYEEKENYSFIQGNVQNKELLRYIVKHNNINVIINFAAESHVDRSILDPEVFVKTNVWGHKYYSRLLKKIRSKSTFKFQRMKSMELWMKKDYLLKRHRLHQIVHTRQVRLAQIY